MAWSLISRAIVGQCMHACLDMAMLATSHQPSCLAAGCRIILPLFDDCIDYIAYKMLLVSCHKNGVNACGSCFLDSMPSAHPCCASNNLDVQVLLEFKEYATEVDVDFVRRSVRAIGRCAISLERAAERCINVLLELIQTKVNYVVQEAIIVIKDIFRRYPNRSVTCLP